LIEMVEHSMAKRGGMWLGGVLVAMLTALGSTARADEPPGPRLVAHTMTWFVARPHSPVWGFHWTMNHFDPRRNDRGRWSIASHYEPLIGPYDSGDPHVIEYHLLMMKVAGLDGLVVDWYGRADLNDYALIHHNTSLLFPVAQRLGLKLALCYEDQTIPRLVEAGRIRPEQRVEHARQELAWLAQYWFRDPAYLKLQGKPVLLSFGRQGLTDDEWSAVLAGLPEPPLYLSEHHRRDVAAGAFDWPVPKEGLAAVDRFLGEAKAWPVAMPVVFPRFHDIYAEAGLHASYGRIADDDGQTFATTLSKALDAKAPLVQVATWNDWGEGTVIEPSVDFGYRDLETLQRVRRTRIDPAFTGQRDDLVAVHRLYLLRVARGDQPAIARQLDEAAGLLATGQGAAGRARLTAIEAQAGGASRP
jgi:hypothetical protein